MATCYDCFHCGACSDAGDSGFSCLIEDVSKCKHFTNKADVVEVVRCKDCIYYESNCCFNRQWDFESSSEIPLVRETDFCSFGERKGVK